jgi:hypothetical protein
MARTVVVKDEDALSALMEECYEQHMVKVDPTSHVYIDDNEILYQLTKDHRNDPVRHDLPASQQTEEVRDLVVAFQIIHGVLGVEY